MPVFFSEMASRNVSTILLVLLIGWNTENSNALSSFGVPNTRPPPPPSPTPLRGEFFFIYWDNFTHTLYVCTLHITYISISNVPEHKLLIYTILLYRVSYC